MILFFQKKKFQKDYGNTIPKATIVWEVEEECADDPIKFVSEWEKDSLKKIFKKYDKGLIFFIFFPIANNFYSR